MSGDFDVSIFLYFSSHSYDLTLEVVCMWRGQQVDYGKRTENCEWVLIKVEK